MAEPTSVMIARAFWKGRRATDPVAIKCGLAVYRFRGHRWSKIAIIVAWAILIALCFKLSQFEVTTPSFDPFSELEIDQHATKLEIKKAYKRLSLIHHPDRGGDEQKFIRIHKAYITLTDEVAHRNWQEYGNSDGPGAINFGMALPKWMIKKENAVIVVGVYALIFLLMLPIVVGCWWSNSKKYSSTQVLLVTIRLYCGSFMYNPFMAVPRIIKLLSSSYEFNSQFNKNIVCRPSDNIELPPLISQIPMFTIFKRAIVGAPYAIKARALIYAHMLRLELPPKSLFLDQQYIIAQCPRLLEEMINSLLIVLTMASEDRAGKKKIPQILASMENCMHITSLLVQALSPTSSVTPLLQLPHIGPTQLRQITHAQRNLKTARQLVALPEVRRRATLACLSDEQYRDVINVLSGMPNLIISCSCAVLDEDDPSIWPLSMVTVSVKITRRPLLNRLAPNVTSNAAGGVVDASTDLRCTDRDASWYLSGGGANTAASGFDDLRFNGDIQQEIEDGLEIEEDFFESGGANGGKSKPAVPVWDKSRQRGSKGGKGGKGVKGKGRYSQHQRGGKVQKQQAPAAAPKTANTIPPTEENIVNGTNDSLPVPNGDVPSLDQPPPEIMTTPEQDEDKTTEEKEELTNDIDGTGERVAAVEAEARRREMNRALEVKPHCSHLVHCPLFPQKKYEGWWIYLVDRKIKQLVTKPVYITSLETEEELILKFVAPPSPGSYLYTLCVRSDSYVDSDFFENVPFTVMSLPDHVLKSLKEAEARHLEGGFSSSSEDDDDVESEDEDDEDFRDGGDSEGDGAYLT
nr:translocation protein SEC63 [Hymenolepis microstoma]